ncbi:MAG: DNA polymerase I [Acidimicrobiales bacterium]|nr:DNA polymerase I [Acidimicrobiales bacterium]MCB9394056.1 DNA polymerase I [Acidimicrobiaceae bacterium]
MKVLLLDGNSLTYRAFFALPTDMATAGGQVTNAVFGFTSMLINLLKDHRPDAIMVAFDRPEPTFRHEANPEYKAQREAAPDILRQQMGLVRQVLEALRIHVFELPGWEADDIIATIATRAESEGHDIVIVTGDRDSYQLVHDPHVKVLYNRRGVSDYAFYDEAGIVERTGVTPAQYPEYAALRGDPSDNLPGVPGVGEKTAAKLITTYGGLDGIFANVDKQTPKLRQNLAEHEAQARANHQLMVLRRDAPIEVDLGGLTVDPDHDEVTRLFDFLEFKSLHDRLYEALGAAGSAPRSSTAEVLHAEVREAASADAAAAAIAAAATLDLAVSWVGEPGRTPLTGLAFVADAASADVWWVPEAIVSDPSVLAALAEHPRVRGHHVKALMRSMLGSGFALDGLQLDTAIAAYLIDPAETRYAVGELLEKYTDFQLGEAADPSSKGQLDFGGGDDGRARAGAEALAVTHLADALESALTQQGMVELYRTIENPLVQVLAKMEHVGIAVDIAELQQLNARLTADCERLTAELHAIVGRPFNINSPIQLRDILYTERGLSPGKKTKTGFSTDAATLEKLRDQWPEFIEPLLTYREVEKLRGTYGTGLLQEVAADGRIHATFNQTVARTGRLSSDQPNLHNIPVRSDEGRLFRRAFVPAGGHQLLVADYNQIELRCIAHLAGDPGLIDAFESGRDIHNATASRVFGVEPEQVTVDMRSKAKMVSYGLAYGMEAYGLGQRLGIPTDEAAVILDAYFTAFPNVKAYMERTVQEARMRGYTETLFGRRRPIPELSNSNFRIRQAGERQAMNAGIQGLAADIFKVALVRIDAALVDAAVASRLVLQVHDEVLVEVPDGEQDRVGPLVIDLMRHAADLDVPLEVNVAWGRTWADAKG